MHMPGAYVIYLVGVRMRPHSNDTLTCGRTISLPHSSEGMLQYPRITCRYIVKRLRCAVAMLQRSADHRTI